MVHDAPLPQSFLLLTIPDCRLISSTGRPSDTQGSLGIVCVTLDTDSFSGWSQTSDQAARDVWLVLRFGSIEIPISPTETIWHSRMSRSYTFTATTLERSPRITVFLPVQETVAAREDAETLNVVLSQYGIVQQIDPDPYGPDADLRGRLVLVDQNDGSYVGALENIQVHENPNMDTNGKNPVVAEYDINAQTISVRSTTPHEQDWLLRSADYLSRGIIIAGDGIASGLSHASSYYISNTAPSPSPLIFSDRTKKNVNRMHMLSGHVVQVSSATIGTIQKGVDRLATMLVGSTTSPGGNQNSNLSPTAPRKSSSMSNRLLASTDMILTAAEQSLTTILKGGTSALSAGVGHTYGPDAGNATDALGQTAQNVALVYIDARGVGRRALFKRMGKGVIRAKLGRNKDVVFSDTPLEPPGLPPRPRSSSPRPPAYSSSSSNTYTPPPPPHSR